MDSENVDKRVEWLQSEKYSAAGDIFGEPQKTARVGDEYQAQIPSLMNKNEQLQLISSPDCHDAKTDVQNHFEFDLSIPITWIHNHHQNKEETLMEIKAKGKSGILGSGTDNGLLAVPCLSVEESWSVMEQDSFTLGLYIFGKNLRVVNKFIGNKGMPHVLSYYYGKFCKSDQHQKWSTYRKKILIKCSPGKKFLKGWRQQELMSRLLPHVIDECKTRLTQVITTYEEGKLSFEKYVFNLRDTVGIELLVEAVAIGIEKQDLTPLEKKRSRKKMERHSFKTGEIIDILKDRIGLSKARLNEVFWEGVWPRLLARGWRSEQPTTYALKPSLVFLAPGVAKFSRRDLIKGSQYFDSFSELLNKVASEPQLLENEHEQSSEDGQDLMLYTIVDTSLVGLVKVRDLTSLSDSEHADMQTSSTISGGIKQDTTGESHKEHVKQSVAESSDSETSNVNKDMANHLDPVVSAIVDKKTDMVKYALVDTSLVGLVKVREMRSLYDSEPTDKQPSSSDSGVVDSPDCEASAVNKDTLNHLDPVASGNVDNKKVRSVNEQPVRKLKLVIKQKPKQHHISKTTNDNAGGEAESMEDPRPKKKRKSLDINLNNPQVCPLSDGDNSLVSTKPLVSPKINANHQELSSLCASNGQRQSTRNRPLTIKALEALANGFLDPKSKRKVSEDRTPRRVRAKTALVTSCGAPALKIT
ncbi:Homeodomain-like protein [Artemisia annua]|uniref:Homeodomain-like protein n=1 Tax=Artemisia annua TaxID=35608 RepID=A0A2U1N3Q5_ARTAN|nr:Homeodomain-like protein [Artemisia annua]